MVSHMSLKAAPGISGCRMMLWGAVMSSPREYRESLTKTSLEDSMTPRPSVTEKKRSSTPTSWMAPFGCTA